MKVLLFLIISVHSVCSLISFDEWRIKYNKSYVKETEIEIEDYKQAFNMHTAYIVLKNTSKEIKYELELNEFADMAFDKFKETYLTIKLPALSDRGSKVIYSGISSKLLQADGTVGSYTAATAPISVDYRNLSLAIKNQLSCGSCWSFSAISVLESRMKILNASYNTTLSEQYLVDCDTTNYGCSGGWPNKAFNWIIQVGGNAVPTSAIYPYYGFKLKSCRSTVKIPMNIRAVVQNSTAGNENMMKEIIANVGPVAVVIDATINFQLYKSGVFYDTTCNSACSSVNHAVVIVGYGRDPTTNMDYWIVKNSWSKLWGQQGYIYMARNRSNNCNIACYAMYVL